jgi:hypothetical protein
MKRAGWILLAIAAAASAVSNGQATDVLVEQLRQDVRELNRVMRDQARQLERLEREIARLKAGAVKRPARPGAAAAADVEARWLSAARWKNVREGMSELEVVELLGPPTAVRSDAPGSKTLIYTLELEGTGFLSGTVLLENARVAGVSEPTLL